MQSKKKTHILLLKTSAFLAVLYLAGSEFHARLKGTPWPELLPHMNAFWLAGLCCLIACASAAWLSWIAQRAIDNRSGAAAACAASWTSAVAKYVPGKFAAFAGNIVVYRDFGVSLRDVVVMNLLAAIGTFRSVFIVLSPAALFYFASPWSGQSVGVLFFGCWAIAFAVSFPSATQAFFSLAGRWGRLSELSAAMRGVRQKEHAALALATCLQSLLFGAAFWLIMNAFNPADLVDIYWMTVAFLVAGLIGFFAFFSPAGLGVREGILLVLLAPWDQSANNGLEISILLIRVFQIGSDFLLLPIGVGLWRRHIGSSKSRAYHAEPDGP